MANSAFSVAGTSSGQSLATVTASSNVSPVNAFQLYYSSGNILTGTFKLYGVPN